MTDYHHDHVVVYAALGGSLRLASTLRAFVTDTVSGDPVNVTQGAVTAAYVDVDTDGRATFTATTPNRLRLTSGATFIDVWPIEVSGPTDAAVAGLVGTASATRTALDGRYPTSTAADARYVQQTATQPINRGGTGATTAAAARTALSVLSVDEIEVAKRPGLTTWRRARAAMATAPAKILCIGDSITEGGLSLSVTARWTSQLATLLAARYSVPTSSLGFLAPYMGVVSTVNPLTVTSGANPAKWGPAAGNSVFFATNAGRLTGTVTGTAIDVHYLRSASSSTFTVKIDGVQVGGAYGGVSGGAIIDGYVQRVAMGAAGSHTVEIVAGSGAGGTYITGINVLNGNESAGLQVFNAGFSGALAAHFSNPDFTSTVGDGIPYWRQALTGVGAHLVIVMLNANDYAGAGTAMATYQANVDTIIANIRGGVVTGAQPQPSILMVTEPKISYAATQQWETYTNCMRTAAKKDGGAEFFDLGTLMPDIGSTEGNASGYYGADTTHPNASGHARIAQILDKVLADVLPV